jgi:hypothetical protein
MSYDRRRPADDDVDFRQAASATAETSASTLTSAALQPLLSNGLIPMLVTRRWRRVKMWFDDSVLDTVC